MDTSYWSPWPGPLTGWRASYTRIDDDDRDLPIDFLADNRYFQLATRPMFELWDNEPLTEQVQAQASAEQIRLFAVYVTDADVTNGGFWQWLGNSYSCLYPSLLEGHRMLGLPGVADLIEDAVRQVFPDNNLPLNQDARNAALNFLISTPDVDDVVERLGQRDLTYYHPETVSGYHSNEELLPLMCLWIDQHADLFFTGAP